MSHYSSHNQATQSTTAIAGGAASASAPSLTAAFSALTNRFFQSEEGKWDEGCKTRFGLEQPLWVWTHRAMGAAASTTSPPPANGSASAAAAFANLTSLEVTRIGHLSHWLISEAHLPGREIAIVCTSQQKRLLAESRHAIGVAGAGANTAANQSGAPFPQPTVRKYTGGSAGRSAGAGSDEVARFARERATITVVDHQELVMAQQQQQHDGGVSSSSSSSPSFLRKHAIVIFALGVPMTVGHTDLMNAVLSEAARRAAHSLCGDAFIFIADAAWLYAPLLKTKCPQWFGLIDGVLHTQLPKIRMPSDFVKSGGLSSPAVASTAGLVAGRLPICCPQHPQQRTLVEGGSAFGGFCSAKCLKPFACRENAVRLAQMAAASPDGKPPSLDAAKLLHRCQNRCHLSAETAAHRACPYPCTATIALCGATCAGGCPSDTNSNGDDNNSNTTNTTNSADDGSCQRCTCAHDIEAALECSHEIIVGIDKETFAPVTERVFHVFRGACSDLRRAKQRCGVMVPTICAACAADFVAPCHVVSGAGHGILESQRTLSCDDCLRRQREIRATARTEIIREIAAKRAQAQADAKMDQYVSRQMAAAGQQSFDVGQRVAIDDVEARREPFESEHPECSFVDFFDEERYLARVRGSNGTVVKRLVGDDNELQYIVLLVTGQHVLFASSGLKAVKAIGNFGMTGFGIAQTFLITAGKETFAAAPEEAGANNVPVTSQFTTLVKPQFGKTAFVIKPITVQPPKELVRTAFNSAEDEGNTAIGANADDHHDSYANPDDEGPRKDILLADIVGTIVGEDAAASVEQCAPMVKLRIDLRLVDVAPSLSSNDASSDEAEEEGGAANATVEETAHSGEGGEPDAKRGPRTEGADGEAKKKKAKPAERLITMIVTAPFLNLEIIDMPEARITDASRQLTGPSAHALFTTAAADAYAQHASRTEALRQKGGASSSVSADWGGAAAASSVAVRDAPASCNEMFTVVGIVNHPIARRGLAPFSAEDDLDEEAGGLLPTSGPCAVLLSRSRQPPQSSATSNANSTSSDSSAAVLPLAIVPLRFAALDEEAAAERQLATAEFARLEFTAAERFREATEAIMFANEERRAKADDAAAGAKRHAIPPPQPPAADADSDAAVDVANATVPEEAEAAAPPLYVVTEAMLRNNGVAPVLSSEAAAVAAASVHNATANPHASSATPMLIRNGNSNDNTTGNSINADRLTPQQRLNGLWAFCYSAPAPIATAEKVAALHARRAAMPTPPSLVALELDRRRQRIAARQPTTKGIEEWSRALDVIGQDQRGDHQYALAISRAAEAAMGVRK